MHGLLVKCLVLSAVSWVAPFDLSAHASVPIKLEKTQEAKASKPLSQMQRELRLRHARELLGRHYSRSTVANGEKVRKINSAVYRWTKSKLPKKYKRQYQAIAQTIIDESLKHEFDPAFLMSVIEGESSWRPEQKGPLDEIGLMQIRPATGEWIAKKFDLRWDGKKTLLDPQSNIKIGAAYLAYLRDRFDMHARLYLAAYNMGQRNVANALEKKVWPKDYPIHVMKLYVEFYQSLSEEQTAVLPQG